MAGQAQIPISPQQQLHDAYSDLLKNLNDAYWAANTMEAKDRIKGFIDELADVLTDLDAADLTKRDEIYDELNNQVNVINKQLKSFQAQIDSLISKINTVKSVISGIAKVLSMAEKVFPAI